MSGASWTSGQLSERTTSQRAITVPPAATSAVPRASQRAAAPPADRARAAALAGAGREAGTLAAKVRLDHPLVGLDRGRRALGDHLAVIEDEHRLAEPHDDLHVVLHEQDRASLVAQAPHRRQEVVEQRAVDAGRRLV